MIDRLETELKKRLAAEPEYAWGRRQSDGWDKATDFIYTMPLWSMLCRRLDGATPALRAYAIHRWFNCWSAYGVEQIFCSLPGVVRAEQGNRLTDFSIQGIPFDHKTTVYPRRFRLPIVEAQAEPARLINWLYANQSRGRRCHFANRLFVVLYDSGGAHWRLRAELALIRRYIARYVNGFNPDKLVKVRIHSGVALSDVIWVERC